VFGLVYRVGQEAFGKCLTVLYRSR
jgi:hypothetical protein